MANITEIGSNLIFFILPIFLITAKLCKWVFKEPSKSLTHLHLPPSPPALPIIGHLHHLKPAVYRSLHSLSSQYGPLLYLHLGSSRCLLVSSASVASEIFKTHDLAFSSRPLFAFADKLRFGTSGFVTAPYGDYWRFMKKLCVADLLGPRQLERSGFIRREELLRFLREVLEKARKNEVVDVGGELMRLTNNVTCRMVMSTRCSEDDGEAEKVIKLVKKSFELAVKLCFGDVLGPLKKLGFWVFGKQAMDVSKRYDEILEKFLQEHEERAKRDGEIENGDLMDILLKVYEDDKAEVKITRTHIKAFILALIPQLKQCNGQLQSSSTILMYSRSLDGRLSQWWEELRLVEESDIQSLPYLQAVVKETLRLYPPGPVINRECRQNCKIKGFDIPEKTAVAINVYAIMRDPESWENPNEFHPERFLVPCKELDDLNNVGSETKGQKLDFVPFGAGRRGCPGSMLAFTLMHTVIAAMVQCFDWKVGGNGDGDGDGDIAKVNMEAGTGLSMTMAHPLLCLPLIHFNPFTA